MKNNIPNKIVVIGGNHHNGLGIIRSMGEIGCRVYFIAVGSRKNYVSKSKYIRKYWYTETEADIINLLFKIFSNEKTKPIIIPSDDFTATFIDNNLNMLLENFIIPNINKEENAVAKKMNKQVMNKLAEKHGLLVPKSYEISFDKIDCLEKYIETIDISYPCIVKPLQSVNGTKSNIRIYSSANELEKGINILKKDCKEVIVQEYIEKDGEIGIQGIVTNKEKEVIIPGVIKKIRQSKIAPGSTTYGKLLKKNSYISNELKKIENLLGDIGYTGIFDVELMFSKGKVYFIELNFRNGAYGYSYTKAGTNLPALWCLDAIGGDIEKENIFITREITLMSEISDFRNVFDNDVSLIKWIKQFVKSDVHLILNKQDLKPFIYRLLYR